MEGLFDNEWGIALVMSAGLMVGLGFIALLLVIA